MSRNNTPAKRSARIGIAVPVSRIEDDLMDSSTVRGQQETQRILLAELFQAVGRLEDALGPILNRPPSMLTANGILNPEQPSISAVVDELELRNTAIRSLIQDVANIQSSLTL